MKYIWQHKAWPNFTWHSDVLLKPLGDVRFRQGALMAQVRELGFDSQQTARADVMVEDVLKTSAIEGEKLDPGAVRSSVGRQLGIKAAGLTYVQDQKADGLVQILLDATGNYSRKLSPERLFAWHAALFPTGYSGMVHIDVARWRDDKHGPMQVISGSVGNRQVHFEAPPAHVIISEMETFLSWVNEKQDTDGIIKAALAHLWFITIHPFDDGNGRIARTLTELLLARDENSAIRFYSLSSQIMAERDDYYDILHSVQTGNLDITKWLKWFLECTSRAIENSSSLLERIMMKARFWKIFAQTPFSDRQIKVINRLLDAGPDGFEGGLKNKKYMGIAHTSRATAQRELADLVQKKILVRCPGGGRSASYDLDWGRLRK